ncbi:MAG: hypothetical protein WBO23_18760 [Burkholderiales bacterium]
MAAREAVVAVDDVDRVGDAADGEDGDGDRERRSPEERVESGNARARD